MEKQLANSKRVRNNKNLLLLFRVDRVIKGKLINVF